jgi:hypothetical protein
MIVKFDAIGLELITLNARARLCFSALASLYQLPSIDWRSRCIRSAAPLAGRARGFPVRPADWIALRYATGGQNSQF